MNSLAVALAASVAELKPVPQLDDWHTDTWNNNTTEPLGADEKRIRWSLPPDTMVVMGRPEAVPKTGPSFTAPFRIGDVFGEPVAGAAETEFSLKIQTSQRGYQWWLFYAPAPTPALPKTNEG